MLPRDGYIRVEFGKKAAKSTITCTVKGVKLKTTFTVKKYTNPCKTFKIGKTNLLSKFNKNDVLRTNKAFKKQKLDIKLKSGWKISSVHVTSGTGSYNNYRVNKSSFSKKITVSNNYGYIYVYCYNEKTKVSECLQINTSTRY